jgi:phosphoglycolate phosphatase
MLVERRLSLPSFVYHATLMRYDCAIFDFDGTLADTTEWFFGSLNDVADKFGFRRTTSAEREALRQLGSREIIRRLQVPMWRMPAIARHMRRQAAANLTSFRLFDGVETQLAHLHDRGMRLAIVSSNAEENVRTVLGPALAKRIDLLSCGSSMFGKATKLRRVMKQLEAAPEKTIYVGDETRDVEAARHVGAASAAVTWGYAAAQALLRENPTLLLAHASELQRLHD